MFQKEKNTNHDFKPKYTKPSINIKPKKKCRRGSKKKTNSNLVLFGVNCNGIKQKLDSLGTILVDINPSVILLQETHVTKVGQIKTANTDKYIYRQKHHGNYF